LTRRFVLTAAVIICAAQAAFSLMLRRDPYLPSPPRLADFPAQFDAWLLVREESIDPDALAMLGPDDSMVRIYNDKDSAAQAELFVAYYRTQLGTKNAHDPKVCLPGAGWNPIESHLSQVPIPGSAGTFPVNYYRIKKGDAEAVVLYWFQTSQGVYTFEQQLRAHRVLDAIRLNRTDMALVRIVVPVTARGLDAADASATQLAKEVFSQMRPYFPPKTGA
jgi:EpsI family protein